VSGGGNTPGGNTPGPTATPTQGSTVPEGCGGNGWGDIVNVGDGLKVGLAADSLSGGVAVVMGAHTNYGWTHTVSSSDAFSPCNASHPGMSWGYGASPGIELQNGYASVPSWTVVNGGPPGAHLIEAGYGQACLTDNGPGKQLTAETCSPGNAAQEWRIPAAG
jgi:serine/threonine-protein kinase